MLLACRINITINRNAEFGQFLDGVAEIAVPFAIAVFAFVWPFLYNVIARLDDKYDSTEFSELLTKDKVFAEFKRCLISNAGLFALYYGMNLFLNSPITIYGHTFEEYVSLVIIVLCGKLTVTTYKVIQRAIDYNNPMHLIEIVSIDKGRSGKLLPLLAKFAVRQNNSDLYEKCMGEIDLLEDVCIIDEVARYALAGTDNVQILMRTIDSIDSLYHLFIDQKTKENKDELYKFLRDIIQYAAEVKKDFFMTAFADKMFVANFKELKDNEQKRIRFLCYLLLAKLLNIRKTNIVDRIYASQSDVLPTEIEEIISTYLQLTKDKLVGVHSFSTIWSGVDKLTVIFLCINHVENNDWLNVDKEEMNAIESKLRGACVRLDNDLVARADFGYSTEQLDYIQNLSAKVQEYQQTNSPQRIYSSLAKCTDDLCNLDVYKNIRLLLGHCSKKTMRGCIDRSLSSFKILDYSLIWTDIDALGNKKVTNHIFQTIKTQMEDILGQLWTVYKGIATLKHKEPISIENIKETILVYTQTSENYFLLIPNDVKELSDYMHDCNRIRTILVNSSNEEYNNTSVILVNKKYLLQTMIETDFIYSNEFEKRTGFKFVCKGENEYANMTLSLPHNQLYYYKTYLPIEFLVETPVHL